ncbi:PilW family protein [Derxia gummosa]|uniref:PilW family protein n=1 Tax=Derxia gummosa DSM 723 TaxID=1121388 RepID=A0A8B6X454_9BURK|nr:PilW family protein [Derxia gummosa]
MSRRAGRRPHGRSLVELLITLTIGLVISIFLTGIYITGQDNARRIDSTQQIDDGARFVQQLLARQLREAGYSPVVGTGRARMYAWGDLNLNAPLYGCTGSFSSAISVAGGLAQPGCTVDAGTSSEMIEVRALTVAANAATGEGQTCVGTDAPALGRQPLPAQPIVVNRFYLATGSSGQSELFCRSNGSNDSQSLASGVEQLVFWYGSNATGDGRQSISRWDRASTVPDWNTVSSVRFCFVMASPGNGSLSAASGDAAASYQDCLGVTRTSAADGRLRRAYWTTVTLRNVVNGSTTPLL